MHRVKVEKNPETPAPEFWGALQDLRFILGELLDEDLDEIEVDRKVAERLRLWELLPQLPGGRAEPPPLFFVLK